MTPSTPTDRPTGSDPVGALLVQCMEELAQGNHGAIEELCRSHPQHVAEIRERMGILLQMGLVEGAAGESDEFPERLGEFRLVRRLGGGGMGVVYEALQEPLGRTVALKLIRPEQLYFPRARERFRRETEAVAKLAHPAIVSIHTVGEERGIPYFAMELVRGATLADVLTMVETRAPESLRGEDLREAVLAGGGFEALEDNEATRRLFDASWCDACTRILFRIADALVHAHARGVLHRDIKPSNIVITPAGRVVLLDFGLASASADVRMTTYGTAVGSALYMAPEQSEGRVDEIDGRTDVYAIGVTLYELLTLQVPYSGKTSDEVRAAIREGHVPSIRARNHRVSRDLEVVCLKAIEGERGRRYESMQAFAADLKRVLDREPIAARPPSAGARAARWLTRNPATAMAAVLALVVLVGVPILLFVQQLQHGRQLEVALAAETQARASATAAREVADRERERSELEARDSEAVARFLSDIFASADPAREHGRRPTAEELLRRGVTRIDSELAHQPELRARLQERMADSFQSLGLYDDALPLAEAALLTRRLLHDANDVRIADTLMRIGELRHADGRTDIGISQFLEAQEVYSCALGASHPKTLKAQLEIANAYCNYNASDIALPLIFEVWATLDQAHADNVQLRQSLLESLAYFHKLERGRSQFGWAAFELAALRAASENSSIEQARTLELLLSAQPMNDAIGRRSLLEESTELHRSLFGEASPRYAETLAMLGAMRYALGELQPALIDLEAAGRILTDSLGAEHPLAMYSQRTAADVELRLERGVAALDRLDRNASAVEQRLGTEHPRPWFSRLTAAQMALHVDGGAGRIEALERLAIEPRFSALDREAIQLRARSLLTQVRLEQGDLAGARREMDRLGANLSAPGTELAVLAAAEIDLEEGEAARAVSQLEQALREPDSRMFEAWRALILSAELELARMSAAPETITRARLERAYGLFKAVFGEQSRVSKRAYRRTISLLGEIEPPGVEGAR
jgi:serine/threonine protein kinase